MDATSGAMQLSRGTKASRHADGCGGLCPILSLSFFLAHGALAERHTLRASSKKRAPVARKCEKRPRCVVHETNRRIQRFRTDIFSPGSQCKYGSELSELLPKNLGFGLVGQNEAQVRGGRTIQASTSFLATCPASA